jgi:hypothetical protein
MLYFASAYDGTCILFIIGLMAADNLCILIFGI